MQAVSLRKVARHIKRYFHTAVAPARNNAAATSDHCSIHGGIDLIVAVSLTLTWYDSLRFSGTSAVAQTQQCKMKWEANADGGGDAS